MTRVAVVGAGVMGCATAWALASRGADVTVLEQFELDHDRGSSHGRSRIVRLSYPDPNWVRLGQEANRGWRELEAESGRELLELNGIVELVASPELTAAEAFEECGVEYEFLDGAAAHARGAVLPEGWTAIFHSEAGIVLADEARHAFLDVARSRGARVEIGCRVESVDDVDADVVVLTAGPWIRRLAPEVPVRVTRETVVYFRLDRPQVPIAELDAETRGHAWFSLPDPVYGLKVGRHHGGIEADPEDDGGPDLELADRVTAWVGARLPEVDPEPAALETCFYTSTDDGSFVCERRGRVVIGSACSGHAFKFAPVVGRRLAALALQ